MNIMQGVTYLGFFTAVFLSYYFYLKFKNKERMAIIEKGVDATELYKQTLLVKKFPWQKIGILVLFLGLGFGFAFIFFIVPPPPFHKHHAFNDNDTFQIILVFSLLIFGGLGLILTKLVDKIGKKKNG